MMKNTAARDYVGELLILMNKGLAKWAKQILEKKYQQNWEDKIQLGRRATRSSSKSSARLLDDPQQTLQIVLDNWNYVFEQQDGASADLRTLLFEIKNVRNAWAHHDAITFEDAYRTADSVARVLDRLNSPEKDNVKRIKQVLISHLACNVNNVEKNKTRTELSLAFEDIAERLQVAMNESQKKAIEHASNANREAESETLSRLEKLRANVERNSELFADAKKNQDSIRNHVSVFSGKIDKNASLLQVIQGRLSQQSTTAQEGIQGVRNEFASHIKEQVVCFQKKVREASSATLKTTLQLKKEIDASKEDLAKTRKAITEEISQTRNESEMQLSKLQNELHSANSHLHEQAKHISDIQAESKALFDNAKEKIQKLTAANIDLSNKLESLESDLTHLRRELKEKSWSRIAGRWLAKVQGIFPRRLFTFSLLKSK